MDAENSVTMSIHGNSIRHITPIYIDIEQFDADMAELAAYRRVDAQIAELTAAGWSVEFRPFRENDALRTVTLRSLTSYRDYHCNTHAEAVDAAYTAAMGKEARDAIK